MNGSNVVLVPLDGLGIAKQAIPLARVIAGESGRIVLLGVMPEPHLSKAPNGDAAVTDEVRSEWAKERTLQDLHATASDLRGVVPMGVTVETQIEYGDPTEEIRNTALQLGASFIVITSHARGMIGRAVFGSVADRLSRTSSVPVVIVHPTELSVGSDVATIRRLLVPIDGSKRGRSSIAVARTLASQLDVPIRLLRVIDFTPSMYTGDPLPLPQSYFDDWRRGARESLEAASSEFDGSGIPVSIEVREGSPFTEIESACEEGDLIVLSSHGRSGLQRWLLGSVAEKLVRSASVPVCLVPSIELEAEAEIIPPVSAPAPA